MHRNHTIVSTDCPVTIEAYLRSTRQSDGTTVPVELEFEINNLFICARPLSGPNDVRVAQELLAEPVYLHMMAVEDHNRTIRGMLFVTFPDPTRDEPWTPDPLFTSPEAAENSPRCFPLGEIDLDAEIRENGEFLTDAKSVLFALAGVDVTCATERAIEDLLRSVNAAA